MRYNPRIPIEYYDFIVTDECHRSIYNLWRQVLEYFDAYLIGLTATPSKQTFGFFNQNLVMEYPRQRAVADGVNVDGEVYRIRTRITEQGSTIEKGWWVGRRDKRTRRQRWEQLDEDFSYDPERAGPPGDFPQPDPHHPDGLPATAWPSFSPGVKRCPRRWSLPRTTTTPRKSCASPGRYSAKATTSARRSPTAPTGVAGEPDQRFPHLLQPAHRRDGGHDRHRHRHQAAGSAALHAGGALAGAVRADAGRGTRVISETDFQSVTTTPNARKTRFVIVDAVGVTEQELVDTGTVERKRSVPLKSLLEAVAVGAVDR